MMEFLRSIAQSVIIDEAMLQTMRQWYQCVTDEAEMFFFLSSIVFC